MRTIASLFLCVDDSWDTYEDERVIMDVFWSCRNDIRKGSVKDFLA